MSPAVSSDVGAAPTVAAGSATNFTTGAVETARHRSAGPVLDAGAVAPAWVGMPAGLAFNAPLTAPFGAPGPWPARVRHPR